MFQCRGRLRKRVIGAFGLLAMDFSRAGAHSMARDAATRTISVTPQEYDKVVVIMHGLGDSAEGFADVAQMFAAQPSMAKVKFVLPTAPVQPVTLNGGMAMNSWYDIEGMDNKSQENCKGIKESQAIIEKLMDDEHKKHNIAYNHMMLAGFSQGGALSIYTGLQLPDEKKLAGILCLSGYLASYSTFQVNPALKDTPILHCHGEQDSMVRFKWARETETKLREAGVSNYKLIPFKGMDHSVDIEELKIALKFIHDCLASSSTASENVKLEEMNTAQLKAAIAEAGLGAQAVGLLEKQDLVDLLKKAREKTEL